MQYYALMMYYDARICVCMTPENLCVFGVEITHSCTRKTERKKCDSMRNMRIYLLLVNLIKTFDCLI